MTPPYETAVHGDGAAPCDSQSYKGPRVRFAATLGGEPKLTVALSEGSEEVSLVLSVDSRGRSSVGVVCVWSRAPADHCVERVGEEAARTAVEAAYVGPVSRFPKVAFDKLHVSPVV
jgi:hypothetical protein